MFLPYTQLHEFLLHFLLNASSPSHLNLFWAMQKKKKRSKKEKLRFCFEVDAKIRLVWTRSGLIRVCINRYQWVKRKPWLHRSIQYSPVWYSKDFHYKNIKKPTTDANAHNLLTNKIQCSIYSIRITNSQAEKNAPLALPCMSPWQCIIEWKRSLEFSGPF